MQRYNSNNGGERHTSGNGDTSRLNYSPWVVMNHAPGYVVNHRVFAGFDLVTSNKLFHCPPSGGEGKVDIHME